jgi:polypeptide N-acetylgalactosaminyltransferase
MKHLLKCRFRKFYFILVLITLISCLMIFYLSKFTLDKLIELQESGKYSHLRERTKIPQIIGHFIGLGASSNLSQDFLNTNEYSPIPDAGEQGIDIYLYI